MSATLMLAKKKKKQNLKPGFICHRLQRCLNFCVDDITTLMLTGATRLEPCVLIQNPIIWEFNPDWEFTVSEHLVQNPIIWEFNPNREFTVSEHLDTEQHHLEIQPLVGIHSKWTLKICRENDLSQEL